MPALLAATFLAVCAGLTFGADDLEEGFLNPPDSARPQTWWHWADGNISKEGITAELEAMKRIGLGGAHMFTVGHYPAVPNPKVPCLSPKWHEMVRFALHECDRLGLAFTVQDCAGWTTAGGPWITPDKNMQHVVYSKHAVKSGMTLKLIAPPSWPQKGKLYYRDIAVLAFPTPAACVDTPVLPAPKVTSSFDGLDLSGLGRSAAEAKKAEGMPSEVAAGQTGWLQFEFPAAVTCRSLSLAGTKACIEPDDHAAMVWASDDGRTFREVCRLSTYVCVYNCAEESVTHAIPQTTASVFRLVWKGPAKLRLRRAVWSAEPAIGAHAGMIGEEGRTLIAEPCLPTEPGTAVSPQQIVDLTGRLDAQGDLNWTAPAGDWTVLRVGYRNTGKGNAPAPREASGLECDKFDCETVSFHFDKYVGAILNDAEAVGSRALAGVLVDSWEAGTQNWSRVFRDEFRSRRGYDVLRYLPALAGFIVADRDVTHRFLRDMRQTGSDLVSEKFYGTLADRSKKHGMKLYAESCGGCGAGVMVADGVQHYLQVDIPMTEAGRPMKEAPSAAHLQGKPIVAMEAFTQGGGANWNDCPASLKSGGDGFLCTGINRIVFHTYAHNADVTKLAPGPAFWKYGLPMSRGQTWWEMGRAWITYLSRCQFLLQRGNAAIDVLYFYGEEPAGPIANLFVKNGRNPDTWPALPKGFEFDLLPAEFLIKSLSVRDGLLAGPNGAAYRLLVLRDSDRMTPEAAAKIKDLVRGGATVLGPKPRRSPSLSGHPQCDRVVCGIGDEVWGDCDGKTVVQHRFGKGRVFWGMPVEKTLATMNLPPDFTATSNDANAEVRFIHRRDRAADIYFVANQRGGVLDIEAGFRVCGMQPEVWDPVTGQTRNAVAFRQAVGRTFVPLHLDRAGSVFVVFRTPIAGDAAGKAKDNDPAFQEVMTLKGPWTVAFAPGWGAPEAVAFTELWDWSKRPEDGIKYYSGTAVYRTKFDWNATRFGAARLDLGVVAVIAEVRVNGVDCGIAWTGPYRVDISKALKQGRNELEVRVANTWANRLIGDEHLDASARSTWTSYHSFTKDSPLVRSGLLGPVTIQYATSN